MDSAKGSDLRSGSGITTPSGLVVSMIDTTPYLAVFYCQSDDILGPSFLDIRAILLLGHKGHTDIAMEA